MKHYKLPLLSQIAVFIADHLPSRIRASIYYDTLENLDDYYEHVEQHDHDSKRYFMAVGGISISKLKEEALIDGLRAVREDN